MVSQPSVRLGGAISPISKRDDAPFRHFRERLRYFQMFEVQTLHCTRGAEWLRLTTDVIRISRCFHEDDFLAKSPPHLHMPGAARFMRKSFPFFLVSFKTTRCQVQRWINGSRMAGLCCNTFRSPSSSRTASPSSKRCGATASSPLPPGPL